MSDALKRFELLQEQLARVRWLNEGYESEEEDELIEKMDEVWWELTPAERERIYERGPRTIIRHKPRPQPERRLTDSASIAASGTVRELREVS